MIESIAGIYKITCILTNKCLIGESGNVRKRVNYHIQNLKGNRHENSYLQKAWNKYGKDNFSFITLEYCEFDQCKIREDYYCKLYNSHNSKFGFNLRPTGLKLKSKFSEELKLKMKNACINSEKYKSRDCGKGMRGKKHSQETRIKMSESRTGITLSIETRQKLSNNLKGKIRSKESVDKQIQNRHLNNPSWHSELTLFNMRKPKLNSRKMSRYNFQCPIEQLDKNENVIVLYNNVDQISKEFNKYKILEVCNNERNTHKNFIWKYKQK